MHESHNMSTRWDTCFIFKKMEVCTSRRQKGKSQGIYKETGDAGIEDMMAEWV